MQTEAGAVRSYGLSESNVYAPRLHAFKQSGEEPELEIQVRTPQGLGASELAGVLRWKTIELIYDLLAAQFFQRDPVVARWLFERVGLMTEGLVTQERPARRAPAAADKALFQFEQRIQLALEFEPVEDGHTHTMEDYLKKIIYERGQEIGSWLIDVISGRWNQCLAAELLRLVSRQKPFTENWRLDVIRTALSSPNVELRDAAVQAAELWEEPQAVEVLQQHEERCAWLADYIKRVVQDLAP
jgi:hypothetical protein